MTKTVRSSLFHKAGKKVSSAPTSYYELVKTLSTNTDRVLGENDQNGRKTLNF